MNCPKCGAAIPSGATVCGNCGAPVPQSKLCPNCQNPVAAEAVICPKCGKQLGHVPAPGGPGKKKPRTPLIIAAAVLGVIVFWAIILNLPTDDSDKTQSSSQVSSQESSQSASKASNTQKSESPKPKDTVKSESQASEVSNGRIASGTYTLPCGMEIQFFDSVRNDVTGNWRRSTTSDSYVPADYALEYYHEMFSSDDEVHSIWNATLGTNTKITIASGILFVDTLQYVKGEEHDAKIMFSGEVLDSKMIDIETGEEIMSSDSSQSDEPVSQEFLNALSKAEIYSSLMHMFKNGLYEQLTSEYGENFPPEAAQYAIDHLQVDYKENALLKAKDYYTQMGMSKEAIRDQLTSEYGEGFTQEEADYAIDNLD